ncbi:phosphotransferase family protein [Saccharopolyspora sp. NPDC000995]
MVSSMVGDYNGAVDLDLVARLLRERAGLTPAGPLRLDLLAGGRSNLTFVLGDGESEWILRRPPLGHVLETAHDMAREVRVQRALRQAGFPVPGILLAVEEPSARFYVMDRVEGSILRSDADLATVPTATRGAIGTAYVDALAQLHRIDAETVGLGDFGRPSGYLQRQLRRWSRQLAASRTRDVPGFDELANRLAADVPDSHRACVVHGDFRLDNMVFGLQHGTVLRAVLDWEMSTVGDPLTDVALVYLFWEGWRGIDNPIAGTAGAHEGYPSWSRLAARYEERSGLPLTNFTWYQAFSFFKLAVILEGIHYRHTNGLTVGAGFTDIGAMVEPLVERGLAQM